MKPTLIALLFVSAVAASPWPWAAPQAGITETNRVRKNPHKEPTPTFEANCDCPEPIIPVDLLSANEKCLMEHSNAMGCYLKAKGGCPSPAPACGLGVMDVTPYG